MTSQQTVSFSSFRLDVPNQQLWRGEEMVPLRPKTFAVLRYLVERAGRLVTRDELVQAVWPNTRGAQSGPKRCILELRVALGDDAEDPRFIGSVGRLGYRFIAPLGNGTSLGNGASSGGSPASRIASPPVPATEARLQGPAVVGRELELAQLHRWLEQALEGERQVVFVTGEPGIGKTSVVEMFLRQVAARSEPLPTAGGISIARGQCVEHYGEGEAYLPVLEAFGQLAGTPGTSLLLDLLRRHAPSWLAQIPALMTEVELDNLQRRLQGATRQRMLREIADVIGVLTAQVPLILVLEDLHWSDYSTLDFLSSITQRREPARLLLIATYRSADIAGDHPLRPVTQELLSHGLARELPLAGLTSTAVDEYLEARFPRQSFPPGFAPLLHLWTDGNPLFLVNLVEDLIATEVLAQAEGLWTLRGAPDAIAARVPANSRRLIEKQMARLAPDLQPYLEAASIAGVEFPAAAVASAMEEDPERTEERCDELVRQDLFLRHMAVDEWPDGTQTTRYRFRHPVYQQLWSERVPAQRQRRFHLLIGERLERSYGPRAGEIASELAMHFDRGGDYRRAVPYRRRAAEKALLRSAHREAIDHLTKALALLEFLPDTPERAHEELLLQIALSVPLTATLGYGAPEVARAYARALDLCRQAEGTAQIVQAFLGSWVFYFVRSELQTALELAERCLEVSRNAEAADLLLDAHNAVGGTLLWLGQLSAAREHLEQSLVLHDRRQHRSYVAHDATDPGVSCLSHLAFTLGYLGYPDQALKRIGEARTLAEELSHPYSLGYALTFAAILHCFRREKRQTQEHAEAAMTLGSEQGFPLWSAMGAILRGWALAGQGRGDEGLPQIQQGLAGFHATGAELGSTAFLALLAEAHGEMGQAEEGLRVLRQALAAADRTGERLYVPEIHRLRGELTLQLHNGGSPAETRPRSRASAIKARAADAGEAELHFLAAIELAREQGAKAWELRAATSLSRLWFRQDRTTEARALLSDVHGWFTEGFETVDVSEAARLLL